MDARLWSRDGTARILLIICYNLLLLLPVINGDDDSSSSSNESKNWHYALRPKIWLTTHRTEYYGTAGGTANEESDDYLPSSISVSFPDYTNSVNSARGGTVGITSNGRTTTTGRTTHTNNGWTSMTTTYRRPVIPFSGSSNEEAESDENNSADGGDANGEDPWTRPMMTTISPPTVGGEYPLVPIERTCFHLQIPRCRCRSPPPRLIPFPDNLLPSSGPGQLKRGRRSHGDCDVFCIGWVLTLVGIVAGAAYKISMNRCHR